MKFLASFVLLVLILFSTDARALEQTQELVRQPRTMAMGGAGIGLADDEYALFQNAAGIAGQDKREFRPAAVGVEGSWDTYANIGPLMAAMNNFSLNSLNAFMGKDLAFRAAEVPMILLPHFSVAYIVDGQFALNQNNLVNPTFNLGYMITQGVQLGTAWSFAQGRHPTDEFRIGVAAKLLSRKGGYYDIGTTGLLEASAGGTKYINSLIGNFGAGMGGDVGVQYLKKLSPRDTVSFGASVTDIGNTHFFNSNAMTIPMAVGAGVGYVKKLDELKMSFDFDIRNITLATSFSNKLHFGSEFSLGFINLFAGLNQLDITYGVGFDLWVIKFMFVSYEEELGPAYGQFQSRRDMLQVNFAMPI